MSVSRYLYDEVMRLDNSICVYCGVRADNLTVDHLVPRSLGGADLIPNLAACCLSCNSRKGAKPLYEAQMFPRYGRYAYVTGRLLETPIQRVPAITVKLPPLQEAYPQPVLLRPWTARDERVCELLEAKLTPGQIIHEIWGVEIGGAAFTRAAQEFSGTLHQLALRVQGAHSP